MIRKGVIRFVSISSLSLWLGACAQPLTSSIPANNNSTAQTTAEVDPVITPAQYVQGLRRVKGLILERPILTAAEASVSTEAEYRRFVASFLEDAQAPLAIQKMFRQIFQLEGSETITQFQGMTNLSIDNDEPSSLAAYLFKEGDDIRKLSTADYCVSRFEDGLAVKTDCTNVGRFSKTSTNTNNAANFFTMATPMDLRAGVISTQAFLMKYAGARDFRRPSKVHEFLLCSPYPDPEETSPWTEQNRQLHPFYYTPAGGDQDCQSCHQSLNRSRGFFTGFGTLGDVQMGQGALRISDSINVNVDARQINDVEAATIQLPDYETLYGRLRTQNFEEVLTTYHGEAITAQNLNPARMGNPSYPKLSEYGAIVSQSPRFSVCMAQRFYNFAMGAGQNMLTHMPARAAATFPTFLESNNYNTKTLLVEIFSSIDFLNR